MICNIKNLTITDKLTNYNILQDVNLAINKADFILITGESGSGKSSLVRFLCQLPKDNYTIKHNSQLKPNIVIKALMQQTSPSLNPAFTVKQHFDFLAKDGRTILRNLGLDEAVYNLYPASLSGGMACRVVLALMLILKPNLLLLDEIDTNLDKDSLIIVQNYLKEQNRQGMAILVVSHQNYLWQSMVSKRYLMQFGKLREVNLSNE